MAGAVGDADPAIAAAAGIATTMRLAIREHAHHNRDIVHLAMSGYPSLDAARICSHDPSCGAFVIASRFPDGAG
jgi:hypothetical protein